MGVGGRRSRGCSGLTSVKDPTGTSAKTALGEFPGTLPRDHEQKCPVPSTPAVLSHQLKEAWIESNLGSNTVKEAKDSTAGGCQLLCLLLFHKFFPHKKSEQPTFVAATPRGHGSQRPFVHYTRLTNLDMIKSLNALCKTYLSVNKLHEALLCACPHGV